MSEHRSETLEDAGRAPRPVTEELPSRSRTPSTGPIIEPNSMIARYRVLGELGAGTMGVVYAAHDPELDRKVAIKLLKPRPEHQQASRQRLQREAQALARLDHPNVVGVYDVGVHAEQLFLAMEFIEGETMREWMEAARRSWPEVLQVLIEAGRGLAAAHGAGLVHRDFKPDNVMIHVNGRVRVMDFGLARAVDHEAVPLDEGSRGRQRPVGRLTETGMLMGTPGYMSRELFDGRSADVRSDLFAYCVTLYEALYNERPFVGTKVWQIMSAVSEGRISAAPPESKVPSWLRAIVVRGLAPEPDDRWANMGELLDALEHTPRRRRRRALLLTCGALASAAAGWMLAGLWQQTHMCEDLDAEVNVIWHEGRRTELAARFAASELGYASDSWERVGEGLDDYAAQWGAARIQTCEDARRGLQSSEQRALRDACLDERLAHLRATIEVLTEADASIIGRAVEMVSSLPRLDRCDDIGALELDAPPVGYAARAEKVVAQQQRLAEAEALQRAGKYKQGLAVTAQVIAAANELHDERLLAQARLREGTLQRYAGAFEASEAALVQAYQLATGLRMTAEAAEAATALVFVVGYQLARYDEGRSWALHAKALARAAGTPEAQALYLNNLGAMAYAAGHYVEAREAWAQALDIRERALGPDHYEVAGSLNNLGVVAHAEGDYERARAYHQRALDIWTKALGPEHPQTSFSLNHLGRVALEQGRHDEARRLHQQALDIRERALGPDHKLVADTLASSGKLAERQGDHEQALAYHERALAIYESALGAEHPTVANAMTERAEVLIELGRAPEAIEALEQALELQPAGKGDQDPRAKTLFALAQALVAVRPPNRARARQLAESARDTYQSVGPKSARELAAVEAWLTEAGKR